MDDKIDYVERGFLLGYAQALKDASEFIESYGTIDHLDAAEAWEKTLERIRQKVRAQG